MKEEAVRDFNRNDRGSFGGGRRFGGGDRAPREMHQAVCDNCGRDCEVPFRPSGDKPIYCSDCFKKMGGGESRGGFGDRRGGGSRPQSQPSVDYRRQFDEVNKKLETILDILLNMKRKPKKESVKELVEKTKAVKEEIAE